ncbi:MAG: hypothetical protein QOI88_2489 [Gammaproteobacteria bacterium]|nr:hypothetical protein [Gammaproteobacteria bacterium]
MTEPPGYALESSLREGGEFIVQRGNGERILLRPARRSVEPQPLLEREAKVDGNLPLSNLSVLDVAPTFRDFEPFEIVYRDGCSFHRRPYRVVRARGRSAGNLNGLVDMRIHHESPCPELGVASTNSLHPMRRTSYRFASINAASCDLDTAPILVATTSPLLKSISVGIPRTWYRAANA